MLVINLIIQLNELMFWIDLNRLDLVPVRAVCTDNVDQMSYYLAQGELETVIWDGKLIFCMVIRFVLFVYIEWWCGLTSGVTEKDLGNV